MSGRPKRIGLPAGAAAAGVALALVLTAALAACGSGGATSTASTRGGAAPLSEERLRDLVLHGVGEDFRRGTHAGPPGFALCLRLGIRRALDKTTLQRLLSIARRPEGAPYAAQALNGLAVPIGDACGSRRFVPELTSAAAVLDGVRIVDTRAHRLGLEYGPYIGVSCPRPNRADCDRVGIDLVLRRDARSVEVTVAGRAVDLVTPGPVPHDAGAAGRDWGGYLSDVGLRRAGSPFHFPAGRRPPDRWAGQPPVYLPVSLLVAYPGGRREAIRLPPTFLSPGFG
jgi:hypothetical protein